MKDFPIIRIDNLYDFSKGEHTRVKNKVIDQIKRAQWDNNYALEMFRQNPHLRLDCMHLLRLK